MDSSTARLLRGFLEPCLLSLLAEHADYGLSLAQRLAAAGLDEVPGGTLSSGPARKYYELTDAGHTELAARRAEWRTFSTAVGALIEGRRVRTEAPS